MIKLRIPLICKCGFNTMDAKEAADHAKKHGRFRGVEIVSTMSAVADGDMLPAACNRNRMNSKQLVCDWCWQDDKRCLYFMECHT